MDMDKAEDTLYDELAGIMERGEEQEFERQF